MFLELRSPPPSSAPSAPEDDDPQAGCKLMDSFGIFIQLCLATFAFSTLIVKRQREQPQRPIRIWALDVSKQLAGGVVVHSLNVFAAVFLGVKPEEGERSNPCVWYFLNIFVDTTLGIGILWLILKGFKYLFNRLQMTGFKSGVYGDPPLKEQLQKWGKQLAVYVLSLLLMKIVVVSLFHVCPWIEDFGDWVLKWTVGNYKLQVVFVMLIFPLVMNIMQFWVIDTFIKHKTDDTKDQTAIRLTREEEDAEILLQSREEDDDADEDENADSRRNGFSEPNEPPPRYSIHDEENPQQSSSANYNKQSNRISDTALSSKKH